MENCPCGSGQEYPACCEPLITGKTHATTAEALMRSRYSAYVKSAIAYLTNTLVPEERATFSPKAAKDWADAAEWRGLEIVKAKGAESDLRGEVEFIARYRLNGEDQEHHEVSTFKKLAGRWYFVKGKILNLLPDDVQVSRSGPCICGSGKKYKRCCGAKK